MIKFINSEGIELGDKLDLSLNTTVKELEAIINQLSNTTEE